MVERAFGNKLTGDEGGRSHGDILDSAPIIEGDGGGAAYGGAQHTIALTNANDVIGGQAKAGFGSYGEHFGNNLFAPPVEFGGGGGYGGGYGGGGYGGDPFSHPARSQNSGGGYFGKEGWVYHRGGNTNIDHMRIAQCRLLYKTEGSVQNVVHLLADFAVEKIDIVHPDATVHNFYGAWAQKVKLKKLLHRLVIDLLTTGNIFIWTKQAKLKSADKNAMKRGIRAEVVGDDLVVRLRDKKLRETDHTISVELEGDEFNTLQELNAACRQEANAGRVNEMMLGQESQADSRNDPADPEKVPKAVEIPWGYTSLNPLQMEPRGSRFANEQYWVMMLSKRDIAPLSKFMTYRYYNDISTTKVNLPEMFKGKLSLVEDKNSPYGAELKLDIDRLSVIQDITKTDYEDWATPQIYPAHKEVMFKRMLREGEVSAMQSIKAAITLIQVGDVLQDKIPTEAMLERVAGALAGGSQANHLVWDDLIDGKVLQPNFGNIFDPKKYEQIDKDIYGALGLAESVMSGKGSFANSFMAIKLLLEKLETLRTNIEDWLMVELKKIAEAMGFRRLPTIVWGLMNLRDENAERKLWIELYDRGIISKQTILERFGTDFDIEEARTNVEAEIEEEANKDLIPKGENDKKFRTPRMVPRGPFRKSEQEEKPKPKPTGRPAGTKGIPQKKKRNTKPKGMAEVLRFQKYYTEAQYNIKLIAELATQLAVETQEVKDSRSLTKGHKEELETIILYTLTGFGPEEHPDESLVYDTLKANNVSYDKEVIALYESALPQASTKEERFDLICNAYATVHADLLEDNDEETTRAIEEGAQDSQEGSPISSEVDRSSGEKD